MFRARLGVAWLRQQVGRWSCNLIVTGLTASPGLSGQVVHTHVPLSPSSIIWYWPKGSDAERLKITVGLGGKCYLPTAGFMAPFTCELTTMVFIKCGTTYTFTWCLPLCFCTNICKYH